MTRLTRVRHEFVEFIPEQLDDGVLYVSIPYATAAHRCCCGCAREVVTPLTPTDWAVTYDGETASLDPSIGNWNFPCKSHYWITRNRVRWAERWSSAQIESGRAHDRARKLAYENEVPQEAASELPGQRPRLLHRILTRMFGR
jgi:hypothetical protein